MKSVYLWPKVNPRYVWIYPSSKTMVQFYISPAHCPPPFPFATDALGELESSVLWSIRCSGGKYTPRSTPSLRAARPPPLPSGLGYLVAGCWVVSGEDGGHWASGKKSSESDGPAGALGRPGGRRGPRRTALGASGPVLSKIEVLW